ncbi:uncharacterized protein [Nicotiana sylvestris]|uniref:uncharacterized protein n=1 Tax=Nicotiana sylvestris TaxID=4096 RepID=UPI00388C5A56
MSRCRWVWTVARRHVAKVPRLQKLKALVGITDDAVDLVDFLTQIHGVNTELQYVRESVDTQLVKLQAFQETTAEQLEKLQKENKDLKIEIQILRRAVANVPQGGEEHTKIKILEPKVFDGVRGSKKLKNFLWDLEHYFATAHILEKDKVTMEVRYFRGDTILWWHMKNTDDESAGRPKVDTWEKLRDALRDKFLPNNSSWVARDHLKQLRQTGSIRDYVKDFSSLCLDIQNMSDEDKFHNFIFGMQGGAQNKIRRQKVKDLPSAIMATYALVDFHSKV